MSGDLLAPSYFYFVILLFLLILSGFFNASETAIVSLKNIESNSLPHKLPDKKREMILKLIRNSSDFIFVSKICINIFMLLMSAFASFAFSVKLSKFLQFINAPKALLVIISIVIITIIITTVYLIFSEIIPKKSVIKDPLKFVIRFSSFLNIIYIVFKPMSFLLSKISNTILRLFNSNSEKSKKTQMEEEIMSILSVSNKKGVIDENTKKMISGIFEFDDTACGNIMTHRTEMTAIEDTSNMSDLVELAINTGFSRIPVFHDDLDDIIGIIYVKDLLRYISKDVSNDTSLTDIMRKPIFIPKTKLCSELFSLMTKSKTQIAIIIDEYGGTEGLVTIEDLIEEILGNIQDEYDLEEDDFKVVSKNTFAVDGTISIDELSELIGKNLPEGDYDTLSGLILEKLGHVPKTPNHEIIKIGNVSFKILKVANRRISKVLIETNNNEN